MDDLHRTQTQLSALGVLNVDQVDEHGWTALHRAADAGDAEGVRVLIAAGADVASRDGHFGWTPLHRAACNLGCPAAVEDKVKCITLLVGAGADVESSDNAGRTALHIAAQFGGTNRGNMAAAERGQMACLAELIRLGADVNRLDSSLGTALLIAREWERTKCVELLVAAGANLHLGTRLLQSAARYGRADCMAALVKHVGVDVDREDEEGKSPFYWAMVGDDDRGVYYRNGDHTKQYRGCRRCIGILFEAGAEFAKPAAWSSTLKKDMFFEYFDDSAHDQAMEYIRKIASFGSYDALVRDHRRVLAALIQTALESRFGKFAPRGVAENILEFWMPPGGW